MDSFLVVVGLLMVEPSLSFTPTVKTRVGGITTAYSYSPPTYSTSSSTIATPSTKTLLFFQWWLVGTGSSELFVGASTKEGTSHRRLLRGGVKILDQLEDVTTAAPSPARVVVVPSERLKQQEQIA